MADDELVEKAVSNAGKKEEGVPPRERGEQVQSSSALAVQGSNRQRKEGWEEEEVVDLLPKYSRPPLSLAPEDVAPDPFQFAMGRDKGGTFLWERV